MSERIASTAEKDNEGHSNRSRASANDLSASRTRVKMDREPFLPFPHEDIEGSIPARFERMVGRFGKKLALGIARDTTYEELDATTNQIARALVSRIGQDNTPIALLVEQGQDFVASILGVLKSGHCYVPLDPAAPLERNRTIVRGADVRGIVTNARNAAYARELAGEATVVDIDDRSGISNDRVDVAIHPHALAYILYTSGSTGTPKGVRETHRNVLHNAMRQTDAFEITAADRQTLLYPTNVYGGTRDIFGALMNGASLHHYPVRELGYGGLFDWIRNEEITLYCSIATVFRYFAQSIPDGERLTSVRSIKLGGEATRRGDVDLYKRHFTDRCILWGGLASTETGTVRQFRVTSTTEIDTDPIPLGYAVPGVEVLVVDATGREVPRGEVGEIVIRSPFLSPGYTDEALTRKVFDEPTPGLRTYRMGDLGWFGPDDCLYHAGRKDLQVKIRGNRVETLEVESQLAKHESIRDAAVTTHEDKRGDKQLVGYYVCRQGKEIAVSELRAFLKSRLPDYMIPVAFVPLDELPLTENGKINRRVLPPPDFEHALANRTIVAPRNEIESALVELWSEVLGVSPVGVDDNFFEIGGQSLSLATLVMRIQRRFGVSLSPASFFDAATVAQMGAEIAKARDEGQTSPMLPPVVRTSRTEAIPLSYAQEPWWHFEQWRPGTPTWNVGRAHWLRGPLDRRALQRAVHEMVRRHETLRTVYRSGDSGPTQTILPETDIEIDHESALGVPESTKAERARAHFAERMSVLFDLERGPVFRAGVLQFSDEEHLFYFGTHHLAADGDGLNVLRDEIGICYEAFSRGQSPALKELTVRYADVALSQRDPTMAEHFTRPAPFWRERLAGARPLDLRGAAERRGTTEVYGPTNHGFSLNADEIEEVRRVCRTRRVTLFMVVVSAIVGVVQRTFGMEDILLVTPVASRPLDADGVLGHFTHSVPLRFRVRPNMSSGELLDQVRGVVLSATTNGTIPQVAFDTPSDRLLRGGWGQLTLNAGAASTEVRSHWGDLEVSPGPIRVIGPGNPLYVAARERPQGLLLSIVARPGLLAPDEVARWERAIRSFLRVMCSSSDACLADVLADISAT
jgi:amino acid adenylation domain-containing protein